MNELSQDSDFQSACRDIAGELKRRSLAAVALIVFMSAALAVSIILPGSRPFLTALFALAGIAGALAALALSALLRFDAALFTLMSTYPEEIAAGRAVDEFLARTQLKPLPEITQPSADRIAGARRLARRQIMALSVSAIATILAMIANFA
ncbi:hypothetical protein [Arvimicrobium flavum]|uniref:hypothetical protein n=1 Tax=Arvimicrobium flavum TaxID=3393320 RepID=UPI00237B0824|nr:hypothetical protein [Mesorhizobium shangrilense]